MASYRESALERTLAFQIRARGLPTPERELVFHPDRRWRLDFAWPDMMVAVELQGGTYTKGRHTRGAALSGEYEKLNEAQRLGWMVLLFDTKAVQKGEAIAYIERTFQTLREFWEFPSISELGA